MSKLTQDEKIGLGCPLSLPILYLIGVVLFWVGLFLAIWKYVL